MAKEPEDKHGASSADGEDTPPESNLPKDDSSAESAEDSGQSELPLGDASEEGGSKAEFPKAKFPNVDSQSEMKETAEEAETAHDDRAGDLLRDVVRALQLQKLAVASAPTADGGSAGGAGTG